MYFNKTNGSSITYCSATGTYYDSNYKTWNSSTQSFDYIDVVFNGTGIIQNCISDSPNYHTKQSPAELHEIYSTYRQKVDAYRDSIIDPISYIVMDDENGAADTFIEASIPYYATVFDAATTYEYEDFDVRSAQFVITSLLDLHVYYSEPDEYLVSGKEQYKLAANEVDSLGDKITAEDCKALQLKYGYLITPELQKIGKIDLLQVNESDYNCTIDQLVEFARYFS
jgi:hypothetical protein